MLAPVAVALVYAGFVNGSGIRDWWSLRSDLLAARARMAVTRAEIARLQAETVELEADPFAIERAIREDLGLARAGETIVRLSPAGHSNPRFP